MPEIRCYDDMDQFGGETVDELEDLEQDLYHRLIEPRGSNLDDPERGLGIEDMLSGALDGTLKHKIEDELSKDPRVRGAAASITEIETGSFRIEIVVAVDEGELKLLLDTNPDGTVRRVT